MEIKNTIRKLIRSRVTDFGVPIEIINMLTEDILTAFDKPSQKRTGATVMTPEASLDADKERKHGANSAYAKPKVL